MTWQAVAAWQGKAWEPGKAKLGEAETRGKVRHSVARQSWEGVTTRAVD